MPFSPIDLLLAWALDAVAGDPPWIPWPHPVVLVGRAATRLEPLLRRPADGPEALLAKGAVFCLALVLGTAAAGWTLLALAGWLHPFLRRALAVYLAYACLATRSLDVAARAVAERVRSRDLEGARRSLAGIVGRDTDALPAPDIARAAVESVAENSADGVVAPLFYLTLGGGLGWGPLLALVYKAVNTLDSTVGYHDERYEHFGKASARLDDLANWVPARLTALLAAAGAQLLRRRGSASLAVAWRDSRLHKSPNSGYPEAAFAGALGIQLGGTNTYQGVLRPSPRIGDPGPTLGPGHVFDALRLLWVVSLLGAAGAALALAVW